jgi:phosphoribosyl 1,2-cyclic phosphate phosphodiesterase
MGETMTNTVEITILGCAGSGGVPFAAGYWGNCDPSNPRNRRTRASIHIQDDDTSVIVDCGPDFHQQCLRAGIEHIDAVFFTHPHSDHVNGMDDLRYVAIKRRIQDEYEYMLPVYMDQYTYDDLFQRFPYMFQVSDDGLYRPLFNVNILNDYQTTTINNMNLTNFLQTHGAGRSLGYRIGDVTYSTDVSALDEKSLDSIKGTKIWIIDCGQYGADEITVHANFSRVMEWESVIKPEKIYLTHLTPRNDYSIINDQTPSHVECAYDGLKIIANI